MPEETERPRERGAPSGWRRPPVRRLRLEPDGDLYDLEERRRVTLKELGDEVKVGRQFRVRHAETDTDCTHEVLLEVLRASLPPQTLSASGGDLFATARQVLSGATDFLGGAGTRRKR
ncbi:polyhydroxyalkanoate synthesis regulator DNA-binding domain-containing protein [Actinomadura oligospora]|uniref:polyhydroxyalkanoate synthesis regulator DNA-binding domain-containing protein n=1 Tax=Actinomadura oligospora TaxID=111804 RepID=UPI00047D6862|nr:polyhydroxyalkanoate synthesis regulator DNA-binding domain-containing protein [Actinomadura oligospora]